jgi:hypothetical protein
MGTGFTPSAARDFMDFTDSAMACIDFATADSRPGNILMIKHIAIAFACDMPIADTCIAVGLQRQLKVSLERRALRVTALLPALASLRRIELQAIRLP